MTKKMVLTEVKGTPYIIYYYLRFPNSLQFSKLRFPWVDYICLAITLPPPPPRSKPKKKCVEKNKIEKEFSYFVKVPEVFSNVGAD